MIFSYEYLSIRLCTSVRVAYLMKHKPRRYRLRFARSTIDTGADGDVARPEAKRFSGSSKVKRVYSYFINMHLISTRIDQHFATTLLATACLKPGVVSSLPPADSLVRQPWFPRFFEVARFETRDCVTAALFAGLSLSQEIFPRAYAGVP